MTAADAATSIEAHNAKYDAIIAQMGGLDAVIPVLPVTVKRIQRALDQGDEHLNTIPLRRWDTAVGAVFKYPKLTDSDFTLTQRQGLPRFPWGLSLSERVCVLKRAAVVAAERKRVP